jgi:hypothetical protein
MTFGPHKLSQFSYARQLGVVGDHICEFPRQVKQWGHPSIHPHSYPKYANAKFLKCGFTISVVPKIASGQCNKNTYAYCSYVYGMYEQPQHGNREHPRTYRFECQNTSSSRL